MKKESVPKLGKGAEEAVTPAFLASLAAKIAPTLCLNEPKQAIEAAARLIECAREHLEMPEADDEKAQLKAEAEHADKYGFNTRGILSFAGGFALQKDPRLWKDKRKEGPYQRERDFVAALRRENLIFPGLPEVTDEGAARTTKEAVEWTTKEAVEALPERLREQRRRADSARKKRVK